MSDNPAISDESILKKTQGIRNQLIDKLTDNGEKIPTDPDSVSLLLEVLKDADRTSLSKMKIKSDDANAHQDRMVALAMAKFGSQMQGNPFEKEISGETIGEDKRATADESLLPKINPVEGNMEIGVSTVTYDAFMEKMEPDEEDE